MEKDKIVFKGSHPDSLYRVAAGGGVGASKVMRVLRLLRWPIALFAVCVALAVFVYFLMPDNMEADINTVNATFWEESFASAQSNSGISKSDRKKPDARSREAETSTRKHTLGTKTSEIDFYGADADNNFDLTSIVDSVTESSTKRKLPIPPVFPKNIEPEVQYGNEKADTERIRSPKLLEDTNTVPNDSTLKPHITQKPEKPLAIYFKDGTGITTTSTEAATRVETFTSAESVNEFASLGERQTTKNNELFQSKLRPLVFKESPLLPKNKKTIFNEPIVVEPELPLEIQEFYSRPVVNADIKFTSGHSKLFGISIEDAEKMKSTTQSSAYNTRVSPTLPTWRDGDDSTTKKYPINVNSDVPQCRSTRIPLCRGVLPYDLAGSPAKFGDVEVTSLLSQIEYLVATNCSDRVKHFACALLEPECSPLPYSSKMPCYNLCKAIVDNCEGFMPRELAGVFNCNQYSSSQCINARSPCYERELTCGDGSCVPRDWICDGTKDCPGGEDEAICAVCEQNEFRCHSGPCIFKRWICDGYTDCPSGEDESEELCGPKPRMRKITENEAGEEPGEESAGSAPAPSIRRPNRVHQLADRTDNLHRIGESDSSKELLETSDSNNAFKRNFTRRPSPSRLTPYSHPMLHEPKQESGEGPVTVRRFLTNIYKETRPKKTENVEEKHDSVEDVNIGDVGIFEDTEKEKKEEPQKRPKLLPKSKITTTTTTLSPSTRLDKSMTKLEKAINGAAMLRKAASANQAEIADESPEVNGTVVDKVDDYSGNAGSLSAHASPCPSGELRCVDGRCIALAQLCDGTIDCSDHADEDNCYT
ncbi:uncharacterized protein [Epargyreus clarus]|uniref:uncharacterized protein isoform X2 n=1 Tax=Epargyreus clarus TaxID=520877 RepID=UPI003C2D144F